MLESHTAYGMALQSDFPLPGMAGRAVAGLPQIALVLRTPAELDAAWSASADAAAWRGRLGDGRELRIQWGGGGDLLFGYEGRARFRLDPSASRLECAPEDAAALDWQRVLISRVLPLISIAHGREALHASAVETPLGAIAIAAPSEAGKSTLARELVRRGWPLFADDVVVLEATGGSVEAHPGSPHMNLGELPAGARADEFGVVLGTMAGEAWVAAPAVATQPCSAAAVVILERVPGRCLEAESLSPSPLALTPFMLGLPDESREREGSRFVLYADLVESARLLRLCADPAVAPAELAETLERALGLTAPHPVGSAA
jgi:hypothetical protein